MSRADSEGEWWHLAVGAAVGIFSQYVSDVTCNLIKGQSLANALVNTSSIVDYISAAASGALAASGVGKFGSAIANATISGVAYIAECEIKNEKVNADEFLCEVVSSAFSAGEGIGGANLRGVYKSSTQALKTAVSPKKIALYTARKSNAIRTAFSEGFSSIWGAVAGGVREEFGEDIWRGIKEWFGR